MVAKGRANGNWRHGMRSGWLEYRYGSTDHRPVSLAGTKHLSSILSPLQRSYAVDRLVELMRGWRQTPFQFEGAARASIRSGLCLCGHSWCRSDHQAAELVGAALQVFGAERPSWAQGQRQYVEPRENCKWCGDELDHENLAAGFCSAEHARAARQQWGFETTKRVDVVYRSLERAIGRIGQKTRECVECGGKFKPAHHGSSQEFCSKICSGARRREYRPPRECEQCGTEFQVRWKNDDARFCGKACVDANRATITVERECHCCGISFTARGKKAQYCSDECQRVAGKFRSGKPPKRLTPTVFDYLFNRRRKAGSNVIYLTPEIFDGWFKRAA